MVHCHQLSPSSTISTIYVNESETNAKVTKKCEWQIFTAIQCQLYLHQYLIVKISKAHILIDIISYQNKLKI